MDVTKESIAHPGLSAEAIFYSGENFQIAAYHLTEMTGHVDPWHVGYPVIHLTCISVELYLKCLAYLHKGAVVRGHDLHRLFMELPKAERNSLSHLWESNFAKSIYGALDPETRGNIPWPPTLVDALAMGGRAFEKSRYIWEDTSSIFMLSDLPEMLRRYILARHPSWNRFYRPKPITYAFGYWHGAASS